MKAKKRDWITDYWYPSSGHPAAHSKLSIIPQVLLQDEPTWILPYYSESPTDYPKTRNTPMLFAWVRNSGGKGAKNVSIFLSINPKYLAVQLAGIQEEAWGKYFHMWNLRVIKKKTVTVYQEVLKH